MSQMAQLQSTIVGLMRKGDKTEEGQHSCKTSSNIDKGHDNTFNQPMKKFSF